MSERLPAGGVRLSAAQLEAIEARWSSRWTPAQIAERLTGVPTPWCVAGGWALDLFRGTQTREHGDLEIAVPAADFPLVRDRIRERFPGHVFDAVSSGRIWADATPAVLAATHQTWLRDPVSGDYLVDVLREPHDGDVWICRRDPFIRRPYVEIIHRTAEGVPYLAPELVLVFKAKLDRPKDRADLEGTVPLMSGMQRATLAGLLARVHPGHAWLAAL